MDISLIIILIVVTAFFVFLNVSIYKMLVRRAVVKYIKPYLAEKGYEIDSVSFVGFLKTGDFKEKGGFALRPFMLGYPIHSTYIYVFYRDKNRDGSVSRMTAKIRGLLLFIRGVDYSSKL